MECLLEMVIGGVEACCLPPVAGLKPGINWSGADPPV
jgi:hypothetical protein